MADKYLARLGVTYTPKALSIHLELLQYPILGKKIRQRMREEIFNRGVITPDRFETEVKDKAMQSQHREHVIPAIEEPVERWEERLAKVEEILTEFYYANNISQAEFMRLVEDTLAQKAPPDSRPGTHIYPNFNPEIAPWKLLFEQGRVYEQIPPEERHVVRHHLREIMVVLIKGMLSDQLSFIKIAKETLSIADLEWIFERRIGRGKIGGKAGGLMLARTILSRPDPDDPPRLQERVRVPESYFVGSDVFYEFLEENDLFVYMDRKYRSYSENTADYPKLVDRYLAGQIPERHRRRLRKLVEEADGHPLIVRSSSLLEDNFGVAFAGKYESVFCPNQGTREENYRALCQAIKQVYATVHAPDALIYRERKGLIDYDERMGVLIQRVEGKRYGSYFFPEVAGVAFSYNPIVWNQRIRREDGFLRAVAGIGTRAVDRVGNDYARMVALSHPTLRPMRTIDEVVQYSQQHLDVINLTNNAVETIPAKALSDLDFPSLRLVGSMLHDGTLEPILMAGPGTVPGQLVLTFDELLKRRSFVATMKGILKKLEKHYHAPVDIEFTIEILKSSPLDFRIHILQCRQQSRRENEDVEAAMPEQVPRESLLLVSRRMVTTGIIRSIRYAVYVDPDDYRRIDNGKRLELSRVVAALNEALEGETFILIGPGRWGSSNMELGVPVSYGDLFNTRALIEVAVACGDSPPEASYGTHFFQDLVESNIYPLPIYPSEADAFFNFNYFRAAPNDLARMLPDRAELAEHIKLVDFDRHDGQRMEIVMNSQQARAIGYLKRD